jgi:hypothetical protein
MLSSLLSAGFEPGRWKSNAGFGRGGYTIFGLGCSCGRARRYSLMNHSAQQRRLGAKPPGKGQAARMDFRSREWLPGDKMAPMLELGCGWGHRLHSLWESGYTNLSGVDIDEECCRIARESLPHEIRIWREDAAPFLKRHEERYARILMFHVLEHFPIDAALELLALIKPRIESGGALVIEVPNLSSLLGANMFFGDLTHRTAFTEFSLIQLLDEAGYSQREVICPAPRFWEAGWRPWRPVRNAAVGWRLNRWMHRTLFTVTGSGPVPRCYCPALLVAARP